MWMMMQRESTSMSGDMAVVVLPMTPQRRMVDQPRGVSVPPV